ncbi:MAG: type II secretion system secretin GspD [Deltaproteobacteria bacterium]|nr:type II secretion system secretin GspD [Deltaproteobacteria bacterium]MBW2082579.1 type II secretion system secretin GspD [Deltaproteobacteria bacterium]
MKTASREDVNRVRNISIAGLLALFLIFGSLGCAIMQGGQKRGFPETGQLTEPVEKDTEKQGPGDLLKPEKKGAENAIMNQDGSQQIAGEQAHEEPGPPKAVAQTVKSTIGKSVSGQSLKPNLSGVNPTNEPSVHVELAFDNADLYEVLDATLYELFKVNYMVDPSLRTKVTFHLSGNYTKLQFINIFNNVLQLSNLAIVKGPGNIYKVTRRAISGGVSNAPLQTQEGNAAVGDITRLIRLRYISAGTAAKNLKPFLSSGATIVQDTVTNSVIITDTSNNIAKAAGILGALDVPYFSDISWQLFPLREVEASEIVNDLEKMLKTGGLFKRPGINEGSFQILPIKTMNAILVASRWPSILTLVEQWIGALDHADESRTNVYVYFVQNGSAVELSDLLKQVFGESVSKKNAERKTIVKPKVKAQVERISAEVTGEVQIIPDETNNAIVIKANNRDYMLIKKVLEKLDNVPRQVLIDVLVAEISLTGSLKYGIEWFLQGHRANYTIQGALDNKVKRPINTPLGSSTGFSLGVYDPISFMRGLITALGSESNVNILSSPSILAIDNKESIIEVGEEVPTVTGQTTSATSGTTITNTIQYRSTGIILKVTPHINSSGLVKMEVSQEVSEKGEFNTALSSYTFLNRKANTTLVAEDGQTIVIGGLMKSNKSVSQAGIPWLRRIPILGYLFGGYEKEAKKSELMILITPHVIKNRSEADEITREFSRKVGGLRNLIRRKK